MRKRTIVAALTATSALVVSALAATGPAEAAAASSHAVAHSRPGWLGHAKYLGDVADSKAVTARVYLAPKGGLDAVRSAAVAMATPGSASYHKFLTTAQYEARFGTPAATVRSVRTWLTGQGLKVTGVAANNRYLTVRGTVGKAQHAFGTSIQRYAHDGQSVQAPNSALKVPAALSAKVLTVTGLDTTKRANKPQDIVKPPAGYRNARPCSSYYGQLDAKYKADFKTPLPQWNGKTLPYAPCGYTGPQFRAFYEGGSTQTGKGASVAIVDAYASNFMAQDAQQYATQHGDGGYSDGQYTEVVANPFTHKADCDPSGWSGEEALDVEAVHAMAPQANIVYYGSASCYDDDFLDTLAKVVTQNKVQLVSNSWGETSDGESTDAIAAYEQVFLQGATEGISFLFSSGDNGDDLASSGIKQTDMPTSDPYVTAVGGTSTGIGYGGSKVFQTGWGTQKYNLSTDGKTWNGIGFTSGAGGGYSTLFNRPSYQDGTVHSPYRGVPDVAMDADPNTGMLIGLTQTFSDGRYYDEYRIGGTSLASPLFAGITALKVQANGGKGYGLLNPTIYAKNNAASFTDVTHAPKYPAEVRVDFANSEDASGGLLYSVREFDKDSSLTTGKGWDDVTGLGTPNKGWLAK